MSQQSDTVTADEAGSKAPSTPIPTATATATATTTATATAATEKTANGSNSNARKAARPRLPVWLAYPRIIGGTLLILFGLALVALSSLFVWQPLRWIKVPPVFTDKLTSFHKRLVCAITMLTAQTFGRPTAIKITGVRLEDWPENTIVMANHQTYVDWAYIWALMYHANVPHGMCALAKDSIRNVPVIGWLLDVFGFVFISRTWSQDKSTVEQHMQKLGESREPCWLTVFPEGTIMYPEGHAKSMAYAQLHGFDHPKRLLLPRITGLFHCLEGLKQQKVRYLMDLTIAYEGMGDDDVPYLVYNVPGILMHGDAPPVIHIDVRLHPVDEIPNDEEKFGDWLRERWMEKDQLLATFSETGSLASQDQYSKWIDMRMDRPVWVELCPFAVIVVPLLFAVDIMYAWLGSTLLYAIYGTLILTVLRSYKLLLE